MKKYRIRSGSLADVVVSSSPIILMILMASVLTMITGTH